MYSFFLYYLLIVLLFGSMLFLFLFENVACYNLIGKISWDKKKLVKKKEYTIIQHIIICLTCLTKKLMKKRMTLDYV